MFLAGGKDPEAKRRFCQRDVRMTKGCVRDTEPLVYVYKGR